MSKIIIPLIFSFCISIFSAQCQVKEDMFQKLNWLEGTWKRTNAKAGRSGTERWIKVSSIEWKGIGINQKGKDTLLTEKLKIVIKDHIIFYVGDVPENKEPVFFQFTSITDTSFVCENPQHDFPQKISYEKNGNKLKAVISGHNKSIEYLFAKTD